MPQRQLHPANRWLPAIDSLGRAHDLLAAQVGPSWEARGRDAEYLWDRTAVHSATTRLADITLTAAVGAGGVASHASRFPRPTGEPMSPAVAALVIFGETATGLNIIHQDSAGRPTSVLDDVGPLLGDHQAHPLDRGLEQLRLVAHRLSQPGMVPNHRALVAFADVAALIAGRAQALHHQAASLGATALRDPARTAAEASGDAMRSWQDVSRSLRRMDSLGSDGSYARHLAGDMARTLDAVTRGAVRGDMRAFPSARRAARRAVLVLPDLADSGVVTVSRLTANKALIARIPEVAPLSPQQGRDLREKYRQAQLASHVAVTATAQLPGQQPLRARADRLASRTPAEIVINELQARLDRTHPIHSGVTRSTPRAGRDQRADLQQEPPAPFAGSDYSR